MNAMKKVVLAAALAASMAMASAPVQAACLFCFPNGTVNAITGNETIPMDTNLGQGLTPATEVYTTAQLNLMGYQFSVLKTTATGEQVSSGVNTLMINSTGSITSMGVSLPTAPVDGQTLEIGSNQTITALQISTAAGVTVSNSPTALTVSTTGSYGYKFIYRTANTTWYRVQ